MTAYQGYYINLDSSTDRQAAMQARLAQLGLAERITRFAALRGDDRPAKLGRPALGCYLSHQALIAAAPRDRVTLVLEDDVSLPDDFAWQLDRLLECALQLPWDLLFLSCTPGFYDFQLVGELLALKHRLAGAATAGGPRRFALLEGERVYRWGAFAYLVRAGAQDKLGAILSRGAELGFLLPVDDFYRYAMQQKLLAVQCLVPFMVGLNMAHPSTHTDRSDAAVHAVSHSMVNLLTEHVDVQPLSAQAHGVLGQAMHSGNGPEALVISQLVYQLVVGMERAPGAPSG